MKLFFAVLIALFFAPFVHGQYYYNDIVVTDLVNKQHVLIRTNHIQYVSAKSFDNNNQPLDGFSIEQEIQNNSARIITSTASPSGGKTISINSYSNNHLSKTVDTGGYVSSITLYTYDTGNRIISITTSITDTFMNSYSQEIHEWHYNGDLPGYMLRIKDNSDTTTIEFKTDEQGNIGEEHWKRKEERQKPIIIIIMKSTS